MPKLPAGQKKKITSTADKMSRSTDAGKMASYSRTKGKLKDVQGDYEGSSRTTGSTNYKTKGGRNVSGRTYQAEYTDGWSQDSRKVATKKQVASDRFVAPRVTGKSTAKNSVTKAKRRPKTM